ncbi:hypothetical protein Nepgr_008326 [Nepenthes gracilis]|uniref:BHLH domain-containing protein n=1 Tax=Nepenthes gracilis TaxID=150966 RepID=A0AAD3S9I8_NEPGR|nr:hypothetical protein Nepgr_008326 [Nepenthes gracilis]
MNSLEDDYLSNNAEFIPAGQQQSLSAESYSSCTTGFNYSHGNSHNLCFDRPSKLLKTKTLKHSSTTSSFPTSRILSFVNPIGSPPDSKKSHGTLKKPKKEAAAAAATAPPPPPSQGYYESQVALKASQQGSNKKVGMMGTTNPMHSQDHIIAERKRREKLCQRFIALSALLPDLKKMDKASVLGDAIKYLKQLQERVKTLEEKAKQRAVESAVIVRKSQICIDHDASSSENFIGTLPEVEASVSDRSVLVRIHCEKQHGLLEKIFGEIEKLHLIVVNSSVLEFGNHDIAITIIAQAFTLSLSHPPNMEAEFSVTANDLVKKLRFAI